MGLLDDLFGKEEINQLKKQLIEKINEVTRLETSLSTLTNSQLAFEQQVTELNNAVAAGSVSHKTLTPGSIKAVLLNQIWTELIHDHS